MKKQSFVLGAIILVVASFINRIIGFIYRVMSIRLVGAEGIGLYEMVFPVYIMFLVLATAGIPLAISKLVSAEIAKNNSAGAYKIFKISLCVLVFSGAFFTCVMYLIFPFLLEVAFSDTRVNLVFKTMIPAVFFISISSAFRGFFQGLQQMLPTALTQVVEQLVRVTVGLFLAKHLIIYGLEYAVTGMAIGMVCGEIVSLIVIMIFFFKNKPLYITTGSRNISTWTILQDIHRLSIPITLTRVFATTILAIEAFILPQRLQVAGMNYREATAIYGQYSGMALSLLVLPTVLTISLAITLIPAISEASAKNNKMLINRLIDRSLILTLLIGIPSSIYFYLFGSDLTYLLFNNKEAGALLKSLSLCCIFLYIQQTTTGILQGLGAVKISLQNTLVGGSIRLVGIYFLTAIPHYGINGAIVAINMSFITMAFLNLVSIAKLTGLNINLGKNLKPILCGFFLLLFTVFLSKLQISANPTLNLLIVLTMASLFYLLSLLLFGIIKFKHLIELRKKIFN